MTKQIVAAIQMCSSLSVDENLETARQLLTAAADRGADLAVLPEMFPAITAQAQDKIRLGGDATSEKIQDFLSTQAKALQLWIVGGTIPILNKTGDRIRAASLVYDDQGKQVARYDKIHLFDVDLDNGESHRESASTEPGDQLVVVDTPIGRLGHSVCYDLRFPSQYRALAAKGAEIFVVPSAFTVPTGLAHWEVLSRSRAIENFCYLIGACQGGTHQSGRKTYGHTHIIHPWGNILASLPDGVGVITAEIDLEELHRIRRSIPVFDYDELDNRISKQR